MNTEPSNLLQQPGKPRRRWIIQVLLGVVIFACGAVAGGGVTLNVVWNRWVESFQHPEIAQQRATARLGGVLGLDAVQQDKVNAVTADHLGKISVLRGSVLPQMNKELDALREEVSAVLKPDQKMRWLKLFDRLRGLLLPTTSKPTKAPSSPSS